MPLFPRLFIRNFTMNLKSFKLSHLVLLVVTASVIYILSQIIILRRINTSNTNILINYHENVIINVANQKPTTNQIQIAFDIINAKESSSQTKQSFKQAFKFQHITDKKQTPSLNAVAQNFGKIRGINSKDIERYKPDSEGFFTCLHSKVYLKFIFKNLKFVKIVGFFPFFRM